MHMLGCVCLIVPQQPATNTYISRTSTHLFIYHCFNNKIDTVLPVSVADPEPPDPHVFGPLNPDPDPLVRGMDPDLGPSIIQQK
jgi:hypothetical protein